MKVRSENPPWRIIWWKQGENPPRPEVIHSHVFVSVGKLHEADGGGEILKIEAIKYEEKT